MAGVSGSAGAVKIFWGTLDLLIRVIGFVMLVAFVRTRETEYAIWAILDFLMLILFAVEKLGENDG